MPIIAAAVVVVGAAIAIKAQIDAANAQANAMQAQGERNARTAEQQARLAERDAALAERTELEEVQALSADIDTMQRRIRRVEGQQVAAIGARGLEMRGSPLEIRSS